MKRIFKYIIILTLIIIIGILLRPVRYARIYDDTSRNIYWMLSLYIRENNGQYPKSQDELIEKGYLRTQFIEGKVEYQYLVDFEEPYVWSKLYYFEKFTIDYGVNLIDLEVKDEKLYDPKSKEHIVLIDGPKVLLLSNDDYDYLSVKLYDEAIKTMKNDQRKIRTGN